MAFLILTETDKAKLREIMTDIAAACKTGGCRRFIGLRRNGSLELFESLAALREALAIPLLRFDSESKTITALSPALVNFGVKQLACQIWNGPITDLGAKGETNQC